MIITSSPLLTDLYQLTMAYGYWKLGMAEQEAVFHLFYRKNPFHGNYAISCGLSPAIDYLANYHFSQSDAEYLLSLKTPHNTPLFSKEFIDYLLQLKFSCDVHAIPEGTVIFPNEPILRIQGPLLQCQLIETPLVNMINYSSLLATKASRVCVAARWDSVIEFGLRRTHGPNGGLMASRACYLGGCDSTSNVLAGKEFGIPVKGTVAHSWVMSFPNELQAFEQFAAIMKDNVTLLVDTYDTTQGVKHAIQVGKQLRAQGSDLLGIRLDSGDLYELSKTARRMLNQAGFKNTKIVASGDLDEYLIAHLKERGAPIDVWGVGTRMVTAYDQPSLDAAYKLGAIRDVNNEWHYKLKRSNTKGKTTNPGIHQVRRFYRDNLMLADVIFDAEYGIKDDLIKNSDRYLDLLIPIFTRGMLIYEDPSLHQSREICIQHVKNFIASNVKDYAVSLEPRLQKIKDDLLEK